MAQNQGAHICTAECQEASPRFKEHYAILLEMLPEADPDYLKHKCLKYFHDTYKLQQFVSKCFSKKDYPTKREYERKKEICQKKQFYTTKFNVQMFLELFPDPFTYFNDPNRKPAINKENNWEDLEYALIFLKNHFNNIYVKTIISKFREHKYDVIRTANDLENVPSNLKAKRKSMPNYQTNNINLLQHIAYVQNKKEIIAYIEGQRTTRKRKISEAKGSGVLNSCECCYDDEILVDETIRCENGHTFCKTCVRKSCEVFMGQGKLDFHCLQNCQMQFSLYDLQMALPPNTFSKIAQKKQLEEVKAAGLKDLEFCASCDFAFIPAPDDKIFRCMNTKCMRETCRMCQKPSHIPLRCNEVEKESDIKIRTYIEDKMTEALVRTCYKCNMKFIKEDGCNKMTCSCGAMMCYVCKQPVKDYKHFNGQGGDKYELCPLFSDTLKLHVRAVYKEAERAKEELGIKENNNTLKFDPARDYRKYYEEQLNKQRRKTNYN
ncbi:hypothetical protein CBL_00042 [Carabus blaptoides fortunei]